MTTLFPKADFTDPSWGRVEGPDWSIEVSAGADEQVTSFALHVRGSGGAPMAVHQILEGLGVRAVDASTGELFRLDDSDQSFKQWRQYRDRVVDG